MLKDYLPGWTLVEGVGRFKNKESCVMSAEVARLRIEQGEHIGTATDRLECACPVLRHCLVDANDEMWWDDDEERTNILGQFVGHIAGTRNDDLTENRIAQLYTRAVGDFASCLEKYGFVQYVKPLREMTFNTKEDFEKFRGFYLNSLPYFDDQTLRLVGNFLRKPTNDTFKNVFVDIASTLWSDSEYGDQKQRDKFLKRLANIYNIPLNI